MGLTPFILYEDISALEAKRKSQGVWQDCCSADAQRCSVQDWDDDYALCKNRPPVCEIVVYMN